MNQNNTHPNEGNTAPGGFADSTPPAHDNPYAAQHRQQAEHTNLDAAAPELRSSELRRMNRQAIGFLALLVLLMAIGALWLFNSVRGNSEKPKSREETLTVPEAPKPPPQPQQPPPQPQTAQAIPVTPPVPMLAPVPKPEPPQKPQGPSLLERRIMAANAGAVGVAEGRSPGMIDPATGLPMGGPSGTIDPATGLPVGGMGGIGGLGGIIDPSTGMPVGMGNPAAAADPNATPANSAYAMKPLAQTSSAQPLRRPDTLMLRGTYIRCVLETHIVTDIPGFTSCIVTEPVYSFNGKRLLLPKGSKVMGKYSTEPNGPRVAVIWDRIVTPTGIDVNMASPGIDNLGGAGHPGYYDEHWPARIGAAMLISLLSDAFKYAAAEHGPQSSTVGAGGVVVQSPYESNTAQTLQNAASSAVRRAANRPATVTIHQGTVINVYVAKDVDFSGVVARF